VVEHKEKVIMAWTVEYLAGKEMILLVVTGEIVDEDTSEKVAETIRLLGEHHSRLVLVDCSAAVTNASLPSLYRLPDYATELGAPWNFLTAVVVSKTRFRMEAFEFFGLVCRNAGYDVRLFEDRESAEEWLLQPRPVRAGAPLAASA
jgi:hypothetical protein